MTKHIISSRALLANILNIHYNKKVLLAFSFVILFSCLPFLLLRTGTNDKFGSAGNTTVTLTFTTSTMHPTKWWINATSTAPSTPPSTDKASNPSVPSPSDCPSNFSSPLKPRTFAYISIVPPLPNRIRAGVGKAYAYLGQIQPGVGVQIIDGPLCADGFSWWLVETVESDLRGWTVAGSNSEQWVMPCPNPAVACKMSPAFQQAAPTSTHSSTRGNNNHTCTSNGIFIGMPTQVKEDNLLVVRSEPYIGSVIGHAGPMSAVMIIDGPACAGGAVWWEVNVPSLDLTGWVTEANLRPCTKEDGCT